MTTVHVVSVHGIHSTIDGSEIDEEGIVISVFSSKAVALKYLKAIEDKNNKDLERKEYLTSLLKVCQYEDKKIPYELEQELITLQCDAYDKDEYQFFIREYKLDATYPLRTKEALFNGY